MKKIIFVLVGLAIMCPTISEAQMQEYKNIKLGIKAGAVVMAATGDKSSLYHEHTNGFKNTHSATGAIALYGDYRINDSWALGSEFGLIAARDNHVAITTYNDAIRPKLYLAPLVKYYIPYVKGLHLTLGPELGITARRLRYTAAMVGAGLVRFKYNPVTFAVNSGVGYRFDKGVVLHAEYSAGLTCVVNKHANKWINKDETVKDGMLRFTIAIDLYRRSK